MGVLGGGWAAGGCILAMCILSKLMWGVLKGTPWPWSQPGAVHVNTSIVLAKVMSVFKLFTSVEFAYNKVWQKTVIVLMNLLDFNEEF
jgi:hypothetical protein